MELAELLNHVTDVIAIENPAALEQNARLPVTMATADSRRVQAETVFVALPGSRTDGHAFLREAATQGARALVIASDRREGLSLPAETPVVVVPDTHKALAELSAALQGFPGKSLRLVGVTGTNGKTTVTHLIERMLSDAGEQTGLIGTLGQKTSGREGYDETGHTTPMATELQAILAGMRTEGAQFVVMEVSSHALEQYRVHGCDFEIAILTNLTQDHLDYHKTMAQYREAKALLFRRLDASGGKKRTAVINLDADHAAEFIQACPPGVQVLTYAIHAPEADIRVLDARYSIAGSSFKVVTPQGEADIRLQLGGQFSVYNALAALGGGLALGLPLDGCVRSLEAVPGIRGRFEVVAQSPYVIVDYAHTPDGLENVLRAARVVTPENAQLIVVFGCGGDRDATKRPKMGRIAEQLADRLVVTSDNPRSEDPQQIMTDILSGIQRFDSSRMLVNADRERAIRQAIDMARPQDIIVVAGKGHEDYQILGDRTIHFDDREVVQNYIQSKRELSSIE